VQGPGFNPQQCKKGKKKILLTVSTMFQNLKLGFKTTKNLARLQWLRPIILAIQEAEIRRIVVQSQSRANNS
jgi:hypothetical protein